MISLVHADLFKLRKRSMGWVMLIILAAFVPLEMVPLAFLTPGNVNYSFPGGLLAGLAPVPIVGNFIMMMDNIVGQNPEEVAVHFAISGMAVKS